VIERRILDVFDRGFRPMIHEVKRVLCHFRLGRYVLKVNDFGSFRFQCSCDRDIVHTIDYGLEREGLAAFLFLLRPDDVVWDIGSSVGLFSVHAANRVKRVVAFEPDPVTFKTLCANISINAVTERVETVQAAVGASSGMLELKSDGAQGRSPSLADIGLHQGSVSVDVKTIDDMIRDGMPVPSVVKIDIEGGENDALKGGIQLLKSEQGPRLIMLEVHPEYLKSFGAEAEDVLEILRDAGYRTLAEHERNDQYHVLVAK
jgi:FkbM family methyltransferase